MIWTVYLGMKEQIHLHVSSFFPCSDIQQYLIAFTLHENVEQWMDLMLNCWNPNFQFAIFTLCLGFVRLCWFWSKWHVEYFQTKNFLKIHAHTNSCTSWKHLKHYVFEFICLNDSTWVWSFLRSKFK